MSNPAGTADLSDRIASELPYLRRYARALTGSQESGDRYAIATLEAILQDRSAFSGEVRARVGLYKCFHAIWTSTGQPVTDAAGGAAARAHDLLRRLGPNTREALLLSTVEELSIDEIGTVMDTDRDEVRHLIDTARRDMEASVTGRVMVIEDEPIIAADITAIVEELGHEVVGTARTRTEAVEMGMRERPDLILADIQLADNSSGIDAVNDLLESMPDTPVIFITAFPERLLTGERREPAFLISKPYKEEQVQSAVSQAMFFASTETLRA
ncbi:response regulator [Jannaschia rubra]|uniref:Putative transcriptional regulatory protein pdtaR n=1 Tax=Jannaschia rubra TaxID=282197 RepID=A0A0M6XXG9_9RHOB|nr:response regulator [Jannaschia rubra]CTQ34775.1 putative transcriptional regulatory protein pdtaR [Jannaschia rubra]SFG70042.1 response regulator receiver protein [Jannaschia rubra]